MMLSERTKLNIAKTLEFQAQVKERGKIPTDVLPDGQQDGFDPLVRGNPQLAVKKATPIKEFDKFFDKVGNLMKDRSGI